MRLSFCKANLGLELERQTQVGLAKGESHRLIVAHTSSLVPTHQAQRPPCPQSNRSQLSNRTHSHVETWEASISSHQLLQEESCSCSSCPNCSSSCSLSKITNCCCCRCCKRVNWC